jgi:hypothetical protein
MVILQPDSVRNDDPAKYVEMPPQGSATLMAAYDAKALYFFILVKTASVADPQDLGCSTADLWKADAAEIYVDPSPWSAFPPDYRSYFTADASGLVFGTSPGTIQIDKPISTRETGVFFRNRASGDRFQMPASLPNGVTVAASPRTATDTGWVGVEMRIPFWTMAPDFAPGNSLFIAWGFNMFGDRARTDCSGDPLAYRWAKNTLNYDNETEKPPGWRRGDSTHYDPSRSWDGWGRLYLSGDRVGNLCKSSDSQAAFDANWDGEYWKTNCFPQVTSVRRLQVRLDRAGMPIPSQAPGRDLMGRRRPAGSSSFLVPASPPH